jgi:hypothetical protein
MRKIFLVVAIVVLLATTAFAEHEGKYKIGGKTYKYFSKTEGQQTVYIFEPVLPDNLQHVYNAVRHGISLTYGTDKLASREPQIVDVQGVKLLKFRAKKGSFVLVTIARNERNRVIGFTMFESDN